MNPPLWLGHSSFTTLLVGGLPLLQSPSCTNVVATVDFYILVNSFMRHWSTDLGLYMVSEVQHYRFLLYLQYHTYYDISTRKVSMSLKIRSLLYLSYFFISQFFMLRDSILGDSKGVIQWFYHFYDSYTIIPLFKWLFMILSLNHDF